MGCIGSKVGENPLVTLCRERKKFIRSACKYRYVLAAAHVSYFQSLKDIGNDLCKFVDEEFSVLGSGSSSPGSTVITLPQNGGEKRKSKTGKKNYSHSVSVDELDSAWDYDTRGGGSHLHLSSGAASDDESGSSMGHIDIVYSPKEQRIPSPRPYAYSPGSWNAYPRRIWSSPGTNTNFYYMKKTATPARKVVFDGRERYSETNGQWPNSSNGHTSYSPYGSGGFFGFPTGLPLNNDDQYNQQLSPAAPRSPVPPSPPSVSAWDYGNIFDTYDYGYTSPNYPQTRYGYGSSLNSPDLEEVRKIEGIPDLEEVTEPEEWGGFYEAKVKLSGNMKNNNSGEGTSKAVPKKTNEESSKELPWRNKYGSPSARGNRISSSPNSIVSINSEKESVQTKGAHVDVEEVSKLDTESSKLSSLTTLSSHSTRDLQESVKDIRDEFEIACSHGKEVAVLLEVGKLPYQPKGTRLKVVLRRIMYLVLPSMLYSPHDYRKGFWLNTRTVKMAKAYSRSKDSKYRFNTKPIHLSSTLDKLYAWEKKLYKEVKDEERLRIIYEKKCKRLKSLDDRGADTRKIEVHQASIRKLLAKINVCIRSVDAISSRIHTLRDKELQPQLSELIHGMIRMWKSMQKCHQKQYQAIMHIKIQSLKVKTGFQQDSSLKAILALEQGLLNWCTQFNNWINAQKAYIESLNHWLFLCLNREPEETPDGTAPFSPGQAGAPPIFVICNDWHQAIATISEEVSNSIQEFALSLRQLWERQEEEQHLSNRLRTLHMDMGRIERDQSIISKVASETGVSPRDDLVKVDLNSLKKRLVEEKARHRDAIKLVQDAASVCIQSGMIPTFESLEKFTSEVLKAHKQVRLLYS